MKYIIDMYDNQLKLNYKLYKVNAKELSERLFKQYKLTKIKLELFNSDSNLARDILTYKSRIGKPYFKGIEEYSYNDIKKTISKLEEGKRFSNPLGISMGYEIMPLAISVRDYDIENGELELIDGFKRMFCIEEVPDIDILVKVYDELNDRDWINSMILYNSWKFVNKSKAEIYMDRGFQLGLYYRYRLMFVNMYTENRDIQYYINIYTNGLGMKYDIFYYEMNRDIKRGVYTTLWNNSEFHNDIKILYKLTNMLPTFTIKKRNKPIEYHKVEDRERRLLEIEEGITLVLGEIRRYEARNKLERKKFDISIIDNFFKREDLQKHFVKVMNMTIPGFRENYVRNNLIEEIRKEMFTKMGYEYIEPRKKEPFKPITGEIEL